MPRRAAPTRIELTHIEPMLATPGPLPPDDGWATEVKWDGARATCAIPGDGTARLRGRSGTDFSGRFPELVEALAKLPGPALIDGEIVIMGEGGTPSFALLQTRLHRTRATTIAAGATATPAMFIGFDLLHTTEPLLRATYTQRRELLEHLGVQGPRVRVPPYWEQAGGAALEWTKTHGLEGVVAKRLTSVYEPGRRSRDWIKTKNLTTADVTIGGWLPGGPAARTVRSLLIGTPEPGGGLNYLGAVGTGFSNAERRALAAVLRRIDAPVSPFSAPLQGLGRGTLVRWVRPVLTGEVEYLELTPAGHLRHPTWRGLRAD